jgi:hypothetical protein
MTTVVSGPPSPDPNLLLMARMGNNGFGNDPAEVFLKQLGSHPQSNVGRATWDHFHGDGLSQVRSAFLVRFDVNADDESPTCMGSAGTGLPLLLDSPDPFTAIERVELTATVRQTTAQREVSWEWAWVEFRYEGGYAEELLLDALPRALTPQKFRQSTSSSPGPSSLNDIEQYASLSANAIVGFSVVGLIRFTANEPPAGPETVGVDDLKVTVAVFTNANQEEEGAAPPDAISAVLEPPPRPKLKHKPKPKLKPRFNYRRGQ